MHAASVNPTPLSDDGTGQALRLLEKAASLEDLRPTWEPSLPRAVAAGRALVRVQAAAVNPSDAKASLGHMPKAVWPRTPGRDFAGTVVGGPSAWIGRQVYGSGGDIGITRDGSHARYLELPVEALHAMPANLSVDEAGAVGVPFVTAYEGFRRSRMPQPGQTVMVMGANGKVGQAAVQLAAQCGARVLAVQRAAGPHPGFASQPVESIDASRCDPGDAALDLTQGRGADIVYNTVGSAYFAAANKAMAKGATQIFIATQDRAVPFEIFTFFRGRHTYVGIDSLALDCVAATQLLDAMREGFERGTLRPFPVVRVHPLADAAQVYRDVLLGSNERIVLHP
jgi:NADPH:quinone reductase-like Zn-dependent oxidoreductase